MHRCGKGCDGGRESPLCFLGFHFFPIDTVTPAIRECRVSKYEKEESYQGDRGERGDQVEKVDVHHSEILVNPDLMNDAFDGENREDEMGVWAAIKSHPWACFWAFTMCFTIVSLVSPYSPWCRRLIPTKSWSCSTCS